MDEQVISNTVETEEAPKGTGFGAVIQQARESKGISLGDMATRSRLSLAQLRAIESENVSQLPEPVYVRAFLRGIANVLDLEPEPLVNDYMKRFVSDEVVKTSNPVPECDGNCELVINNRQGHRGLKALWILILIIVAAVGGWYVYTDFFSVSNKSEASLVRVHNETGEVSIEKAPAANDAKATEGANAETTPAATSPSTEAQTAAPATGDAAASNAPQGTNDNANGAAANDAKSSAVDKLPEDPLSQAPTEQQLAVANEAPQPASEIEHTPVHKSVMAEDTKKVRLNFALSKDCWAQVTAPDGKLVYSGIMKEGSSKVFDAPKGSRVTLGKADAVRLTVNGQPFNVLKNAQGNVARFVVK